MPDRPNLYDPVEHEIVPIDFDRVDARYLLGDVRGAVEERRVQALVDVRRVRLERERRDRRVRVAGEVEYAGGMAGAEPESADARCGGEHEDAVTDVYVLVLHGAVVEVAACGAD